MGRRGKQQHSPVDTIKFLTKEQYRAFIRAIPKRNIRDRLLFNLMYLHALRRGEAARLRLENIDISEGRIYVVRLKGGRSLWYPMFSSSLTLLRQYLTVRPDDGCPYLFRGKRRRCAPLSGRTIFELYRRYATKAGLPPDLRHPHALRHTLGTHLANAGIDISDAQEQLGHADISSTQIYFQITERRRKKVHRRMRRSREIVGK